MSVPESGLEMPHGKINQTSFEMAREISQEKGFQRGDMVVIESDPSRTGYEIREIKGDTAILHADAVPDLVTGEFDSLERTISVPLRELCQLDVFTDIHRNNSQVIH